MLKFNLCLCAFAFNGSNQIVAQVPTKHDYKISNGPAEIILFSPSILPADIVAVKEIENNPDLQEVTFNFSMPFIF
jgi:hypothetical protein